MKTEIKKKEMQVYWKLGVTHSTRERQREREREKTQKTIFQKNSNSILFNVHMCVFNAHFYTSLYKD